MFRYPNTKRTKKKKKRQSISILVAKTKICVTAHKKYTYFLGIKTVLLVALFCK